MADELDLITTNAAVDSWVDNVPSAVSTGYQNQNTGIEGLWNGMDNSSISLNGLNADIAISGIIDESGLPFVVKTAFSLTLPTTGYNHYIKLIAGTGALDRSMAFTASRGTYDAAKNGFYSGTGERVLNWVYNVPSGELHKIGPFKEDADIRLGSYMQIDSGTSSTAVISSYTKYANYATPTTDKLAEWEFSGSDRFVAREDGVRKVYATMDYNWGSATDNLYLAIYKNGTIFRQVNINTDDVNDITLTIAFEVPMVETDYIEIFVRNSAGNTTVGASFASLTISSEKDLF